MATPVRATIQPSGVQAVMVQPCPVFASPVAPTFRWAASVLTAHRPLPATLCRMDPTGLTIDPQIPPILGPCGRQVATFLPKVYWRGGQRKGWQLYPKG